MSRVEFYVCRAKLEGFFFFLFNSLAVVPVHKILQFSISNYTHHDSYGVFRCGGIFSHPYCEGMNLYILYFLFH